MTKERIRKMENSELLAHLFIARDNLIVIRRKMSDNHSTQELLELFDSGREQYDLLLNEIYRRMEHVKK